LRINPSIPGAEGERIDTGKRRVRQAAGRRRERQSHTGWNAAGDELDVRLVVGMARWYPESDDGPWIDVATVSEEGGLPQIPAPLIRVPAGTRIALTMRNALPDSTMRRSL
jgi:hypothetical protein